MPFCHIDTLNFSLRKQKTATELNLANAKLENTSNIKQSTLSDSHLFIDPTPLKLLLPGLETGAPPAVRKDVTDVTDVSTSFSTSW